MVKQPRVRVKPDRFHATYPADEQLIDIILENACVSLTDYEATRANHRHVYDTKEWRVDIAIIDGEYSYYDFFSDFVYFFVDNGFNAYPDNCDELRIYNSHWCYLAGNELDEYELWMGFFAAGLKDGGNVASTLSEISCLIGQHFSMYLIDGIGQSWEIDFYFING